VPRSIALTGGIGSGKSTAAKIFAEKGVPTLDLDRVGHCCLEELSVQAQLVAHFGLDILDARGSVQRNKLASKAFSSAQATEHLNCILHPAILAKEQAWLHQQCAPYVLIEASVLLESSGEARMDAVAVVLADVELRRQRVLQRGLQDAAAFERILKRQCDDALRRKKADYILDNSGGLSALEVQIMRLHERWMCDYG